MSSSKDFDKPKREEDAESVEKPDTGPTVATSEVSSKTRTTTKSKDGRQSSTTSERQIKFERAQKCLENAALVSKRIKEHRKATAELLGRTFEDDDTASTVDTSDMVSTVSERTGYSAADSTSTMSVQEALNIPGISESLANTLKQKELLMERINQYKQMSKRTLTKPSQAKSSQVKRESSVTVDKANTKKVTETTDSSQLQSALKEKETALSIMQVKMRAMETTILDLQEKISEKDQLIEAKTKASSLMSDNLSKKEKDSISLLEDTRQQMIKMQENFIAMETEWKEEKTKLTQEIEAKNYKIASLEEGNTILENLRFEISLENSKLIQELEDKNKEIADLHEKLNNLAETSIKLETQTDIEEEKGSREIANMVEMTKKIELLEQLNCQIRQTNMELESKLANATQEKAASSSPKKSPLVTRKGGKANVRNPATKKSPWSTVTEIAEAEKKIDKSSKADTVTAKLEMMIATLNKEILDKEYLLSEKQTVIDNLKKEMCDIQHLLKEKDKALKNVSQKADMIDAAIETEYTRESLTETVKVFAEKTVENPTQDSDEEFSIEEVKSKLQEAEKQIALLNTDLEAANRSMIKVQAAHKLKMKQMQKTIDNFSKMSDANAEVSKLSEEVNTLTQKVAELEEDKGNLQLHLVDYDSGRLTESEAHKKLNEVEKLSESRLKAISELEMQKFDLVQELHILQQKNVEIEDQLTDMMQLQNDHVCTEMKSVELEEQLDSLTAAKHELEMVIENLKLDKDHFNQTIQHLEEQKAELSNKLDHYAQENIELSDRLEKLSAEKVSSAESIEIVESLTTQEKIELEEYTKKMEPQSQSVLENELKPETDTDIVEFNENIAKLTEESAELNQKIELFTQERHEVMEKMSRLSLENTELFNRIENLVAKSVDLEVKVEAFTEEKQQLEKLNQDLIDQIEQLKSEQLEVIKESTSITKPMLSEDATDGAMEASDDKAEKAKKEKAAKNMTKEVLRLKNVLKEREAEIADCQMKILSLEESHQKQNEILQANAKIEANLQIVTDERNNLLQEIEFLRHQNLNALHAEVTKSQIEIQSVLNARDTRINELEELLLDYENQIKTYVFTIQEKDKDITEYLNQITKLNDVSQKLKSTIEVLEEEKAKDQNAEIIKGLNKQIVVYQNNLKECEAKIKQYAEEETRINAAKGDLEKKITMIEAELIKLNETHAEKLESIKDLQTKQDRHASEVSALTDKCKERDEEIHEVKLQLRKESIENENLRKSITDLELFKEINLKEINITQQKSVEDQVTIKDLTDKTIALEAKNKEVMEKLKKFAVTLKKKNAAYIELEAELSRLNELLQSKQLEIENLLSNNTNNLQENIVVLENELTNVRSQLMIEQNKINELETQMAELKSVEVNLTNENEVLKQNELTARNEINRLVEENNILKENLSLNQQKINSLGGTIEGLNNRLAEYEHEQKNNANLLTKISGLEADINQKQTQISELLNKLDNVEYDYNNFKFGYEAKLQERDLYIENMEVEINKYKNRICRLEESVSHMEDRRQSLERKADQLDSQLNEKQRAYSDYGHQEDELVNRLAVLMDHDRVVEKQIQEVERENLELQFKIQNLLESNNSLQRDLFETQQQCKQLQDKAQNSEIAETTANTAINKVVELEAFITKITTEYQATINKNQEQIEYLESEFNTQIEDAIREKKILTDKLEKTNEINVQLEHKVNEYCYDIKNLNMSIEELNCQNKALTDGNVQESRDKTDYTEQYIAEINNLRACVNAKDDEINIMSEKFKQQLTTLTRNAEQNMLTLNEETRGKDAINAILNDQVTTMSSELEVLRNSIKNLNIEVSDLKNSLAERDETIKKITEKNSFKIEMNIPKTEGMVITSTIKNLGEVPKFFDMSALESQIVSDDDFIPTVPSERMVKAFEHGITQKSAPGTSPQTSIEEVIKPRKAYECKKDDESVVQQETVQQSSVSQTQAEPDIDPFNSDEGWGFGDMPAETTSPEVFNLNQQVIKLTMENDSLKTELGTLNAKLLKAMKKLKEMKGQSERLTNELKIAKQLDQSSFLDTAIEDELRNHIKELEENNAQLTIHLNKETHDKEIVKKQNEIFNNANDRLTEIKEKLENDLELWKFKFKEANDKLANVDWDQEQKHDSKVKVESVSEDPKLKETIEKLERENDELNVLVDELSQQNINYANSEARLREENINYADSEARLREELVAVNIQLVSIQNQPAECGYCFVLEKRVLDLNKEYEAYKVMEEQAFKKDLAATKTNVEADLKAYFFEHFEKRIEEKSKSYKDKLNQALEKNLELESQLLDAKSDIEIFIAQVSVLNENIEREKIPRKSLEVQLASANEDINIKKNIIFELENKIKALTTDKEQSASDNVLSFTEKNALETQLFTTNEELQSYKAKVSELDAKIQSLNIQNDQLSTTVNELRSLEKSLPLEGQIYSVNEELISYKAKVTELEDKIQKLNVENDQLLATVTELRNSVTVAVDQRGYEVAEMWKQHLNQREADFSSEEHNLRLQINEFESKYEQLMSSVQNSTQDETNKMIIEEQVNQLQNKLKDKEESLVNLQAKYSEIVTQMDLLRSEINDEKILLDNKLLAQQEEYELKIKEITSKETDSQNKDKKISELHTEINAVKEYGEQVMLENNSLKETVSTLGSQINDLMKKIAIKDSELYQKTEEFNRILTQRNEEFENIRKQLVDCEKKIEDLTYEKESELAVLRLKLHDQSSTHDNKFKASEQERSDLLETLQEKIKEAVILNKEVTDLRIQIEESAIKTQEMQQALENQEYEIVTLKDEISTLQEALRGASKIEKRVHFATDTKPGDEVDDTMQNDLLDAVPRAELDLALYMLHQRDMRCEELTVELTQLLEERDTLQLRLSDCIRSYEELRTKCRVSGVELTPPLAAEESRTFISYEKESTGHQVSARSSVSELDEDKPKLHAKLSELRTVRHSRDVRLRNESEQRQLDMQLLHRDVANLPPQAADQLLQAHHTLSRDAQSTSTVLLNWLRGKSTPKVVHM